MKTRWKGCVCFFCLPSLFEIKSLRWSLQSWWIDSIEAVCMCDIVCILHIFMRKRCAFLRALMLSFTVPQNKCAVHIYCSPVWKCELWGWDYQILFCIIFLSVNMYSFRTAESLFVGTWLVMWIYLSQAEKKIRILLRYKMWNNSGDFKLT